MEHLEAWIFVGVEFSRVLKGAARTAWNITIHVRAVAVDVHSNVASERRRRYFLAIYELFLRVIIFTQVIWVWIESTLRDVTSSYNNQSQLKMDVGA